MTAPLFLHSRKIKCVNDTEKELNKIATWSKDIN